MSILIDIGAIIILLFTYYFSKYIYRCYTDYIKMCRTRQIIYSCCQMGIVIGTVYYVSGIKKNIHILKKFIPKESINKSNKNNDIGNIISDNIPFLLDIYKSLTHTTENKNIIEIMSNAFSQMSEQNNTE